MQKSGSRTDRVGIIYLITNRINGKTYVGQTIQPLSRRWSEHKKASKNGSECALHRAIAKYGKDAFTVEVIAESLEPFLDNLETMFIDLHCSHKGNHGYNLTLGGEGTRGHRWSEESKNKLSVVMTGRKVPPFSEEHRRKIGEANKRKVISLQQRQQISKALTGLTHSVATRQARSEALKGRIVSADTRQKQSESAKALPKNTCIRCGYQGHAVNVKRWHNDNCKYPVTQVAA